MGPKEFDKGRTYVRTYVLVSSGHASPVSRIHPCYLFLRKTVLRVKNALNSSLASVGGGT